MRTASKREGEAKRGRGRGRKLRRESVDHLSLWNRDASVWMVWPRRCDLLNLANQLELFPSGWLDSCGFADDVCTYTAGTHRATDIGSSWHCRPGYGRQEGIVHEPYVAIVQSPIDFFCGVVSSINTPGDAGRRARNIASPLRPTTPANSLHSHIHTLLTYIHTYTTHTHTLHTYIRSRNIWPPDERAQSRDRDRPPCM